MFFLVVPQRLQSPPWANKKRMMSPAATLKSATSPPPPPVAQPSTSSSTSTSSTTQSLLLSSLAMALPPSPPSSPPQSQQHPNVHITYAGTYQGDDFRLPVVAPNAKISGSAVHILHPHTSTHSYVEGKDSYPHHLSILPTHLNVEGGDSYPHQLSVLPRITHLDVEGGESLPLQVAAWPQLGGPQNQNSRDTSVCEGHGAPRPPEVSFGQNFECEDTPK